MTRVVVLPPTTRLPPIRTLNNVPLGLLHEAIQYLQHVYNPEIHTSRRISTTNDNGSTTPAGGKVEPEAEPAQVLDAFEHVFVVRWLTALVAQKTTVCAASSSDANKTDKNNENDYDHDDNNSASNLESLVQSAAALLAICAGAASAGTRRRTYVLGGRVRVQLTDVALRNDDFGSVGAQTWGSACVLAEMIAHSPARFGLHCGDGKSHDDDTSPLCLSGERPAAMRVLELGAGTGLVSLTIGKILETDHGCRDRSHRAEIVASDFYPPVLDNLRLNILRNFPSKGGCDSDSTPPGHHLLSISAHFLDWEAAAAADPTTRTIGEPFDVPFDEVFGTDIVYELEHAAWINACLRRFLRLTGRFHLVMPLREGFARESASVERVFPRSEDIRGVVVPTLCITQQEHITCEAWPDGKGEVEYVHYTIQWATCGDRGDHEYGGPLDI